MGNMRKAMSAKDHFSDSTRRTSEFAGVQFQGGDQVKGRMTLLKYDADKTLRGCGPFRVLFSAAISSTVITMASPTKLICSLVIAVGTYMCTVILSLRPLERGTDKFNGADTATDVNGTAAVAYAAADFPGRDAFDLSEISNALGFINSLLGFLLGLYVSSAVSRWWSMRMNCVGGLWGCVDDLMLWAAAWWSSGSEADDMARHIVLRYGQLSMILFFAQARGELSETDDPDTAGLTDCINSLLLTPAEAEALAPLPSKPQVVWAWIAAFLTKALSRSGEATAGDITPVPHAAHLMPHVMDKCAVARGCIGGGLAHVDTQQPLAYAHLLSLMTWTCVILNALLMGLKLAYDGVATDANGWFVFNPGWPLIFGGIVKIIIMPVCYDGLLGVGTILDNPLGYDHNNFPSEAFAHYMHAESKAYCTGVDAVRESWWEGTGLAFDALPSMSFKEASFNSVSLDTITDKGDAKTKDLSAQVDNRAAGAAV